MMDSEFLLKLFTIQYSVVGLSLFQYIQEAILLVMVWWKSNVCVCVWVCVFLWESIIAHSLSMYYDIILSMNVHECFSPHPSFQWPILEFYGGKSWSQLSP